MKIWKILSRQSSKYWFNLVVTVLGLLALLVFVDFYSWKHNFIFDLSPTKVYSLSPQTVKILKALKKDVKATIFYEKGERASFTDTMNRYTYVNPKFTFGLIDLDRNPGECRKYGVTSYGSTVVECGKKKKIIGYPSEERIVNAILNVTRDKEKVIYLLKGHGESNFYDDGKEGFSQAREAMEQENYLVKELFLMREEGVPPDASLLIVSGPKKELLENETESISKYIKEGGKALFMIDPYTVPSLVSFLEKFGIILGNDIIVDKKNRLFGGEYLMPIVPFYYKDHPIIRDFTTATVFSLARSVEAKEEMEEGISAKILAKTDIESWAETDKKSIDQRTPGFNEGKDKKGPVPVAVVVSVAIDDKNSKDDETKTKKEKVKEGKIVVYGDSDFASNFYLNILGNQDLALNTVNWLAEEEDLISLRPKTKKALPVSPLFLTASQGKIIFWSSVIVQPALVLLIGIIIYFRRKIRG